MDKGYLLLILFGAVSGVVGALVVAAARWLLERLIEGIGAVAWHFRSPKG